MSSRESAVIDTNLLVRYLTADHPAQAAAVNRLLDRAGRGEISLVVPAMVFAELVWVLQSYYQLEREKITALLESILQTPGFDFPEEAAVRHALETYRETNVDFIDAWIAAFALGHKIPVVMTFDKKHFSRIPGINAITPG